MFTKKTSLLTFIFALLTTTFATAQATFTPLYHSSLLRVSADYDTILQKTWEGVKRTLIDAYPQSGTTARMVHRPKSNFPHDAVSEGIAYGMYLALYANDQAYFNILLEGAERWMWSNGAALYNWRRDRNGADNSAMGPHNNGAASDADQDIALLLIFADRLVERGIWQPYSNSQYPNLNTEKYEGRARRILATIRGTMITQGKYLRPGNGDWSDGTNANGTQGTINPGYFAPAFYRVFAEFEPAHAATWNALIDGSYELIARSPGYARGLLPDWVDFQGGSTGGAGYNAYRAGDAMYRDAIRVYWRLAKDFLWYGEPRAKQFLDNAINFLEGLGGPEHADFFEMDGSLLPANDVEVLAWGAGSPLPGHPNNSGIVRSRREHSHLTVGMWAAAAIGTGNVALAERYSERLLSFYEGGDLWGNAVDPTVSGGRTIANAVALNPGGGGNLTFTNIKVPEDTLHNEMYFDQFLAWFGAALLAGITTNVWDDLRDGIPDNTPLSWRTAPAISPENRVIDAREEPMQLNASISRRTPWFVTLTHDETNASVSFSGNSDTIAVSWFGMSSSGSYMPQGLYHVSVNAGTLAYTNRVWLGMPFDNRPNLLTGNRLLVDDFVDGDVFPYIGSIWNTTTGTGGGIPTANITFPQADVLQFNYTLPAPGWRFSALNWQMGETTNFSGGVVDTIIFTASSSVNNLSVSLQLLSADIAAGGDCFFEHRITMPTAETTFRIPLVDDRSVWNQRTTCSGGTSSGFTSSLTQITGIRWHVQYESDEPTGSGAITFDNIYFAGANIGTLYSVETPPSEFLEPDENALTGIRNRAAAMRNQYQIRHSGNMVRMTLPQTMVGATANIIDIRGRVVYRANVPANGRLELHTRNLAAGVYFVDIRKQGQANIRVPLRLAR